MVFYTNIDFSDMYSYRKMLNTFNNQIIFHLVQFGLLVPLILNKTRFFNPCSKPHFSEQSCFSSTKRLPFFVTCINNNYLPLQKWWPYYHLESEKVPQRAWSHAAAILFRTVPLTPINLQTSPWWLYLFPLK